MKINLLTLVNKKHFICLRPPAADYGGCRSIDFEGGPAVTRTPSDVKSRGDHVALREAKGGERRRVKARNSIFICLFFIIVTGFLLRLIIIQRDLYFDEVFSANISQLNFKGINQNISQDILHVPFYYYILHCWIKLFGDSDINIRLLSVFFGLLSIIIIYLVGKIFYNRYIGLITALLLSLSSLHLVISQEARMYSLVFLLSLLSIYFFWRGLHENKRIFWIAYTLFTILAIYTHYQAWFLLAAQNIFFIELIATFCKL